MDLTVSWFLPYSLLDSFWNHFLSISDILIVLMSWHMLVIDLNVTILFLHQSSNKCGLWQQLCMETKGSLHTQMGVRKRADERHFYCSHFPSLHSHWSCKGVKMTLLVVYVWCRWSIRYIITTMADGPTPVCFFL